MATAEEISAIGQNQKRKLVFPMVESFSALFDKVQPWNYKPEHIGPKPLLTFPSWDAEWERKNYPGRPMPRFSIGPYLTFHTNNGKYRNSLEVLSITSKLVSWITAGGILYCSNDTTHFQVNFWPKKRALVTIKHGQIIGSHYLAVINSSTIPSFPEGDE